MGEQKDTFSMSEKKHNYNKDIVIGGERWLSEPRSRMISRGLKIAESLERTALTIIRDIILDIRKDGLLIKVAIIDPVKIKGKQFSQFCVGPVFNEKELPADEIIRDYDYRIGDTITIEYSGPDYVLPFMQTNVVKEKRTGSEKVFITVPDKCPVCGCKLKIGQLHPGYYYCIGNACPGRIKAQLISFSNSMGIGLKPEMAKDLVDKRMVSDASDLYFLKKKDLMQLNEMNEQSAQRILDAIEKSRHLNPYNMIFAFLVMEGIRSTAAFELSSYCNSIDDLLDAEIIAKIRPNKYLGIYQDDIIRIQKLIKQLRTLKFLEKLKKGGVVFSRCEFK
jgi:DNA ligase (NAD+)